MKNILFIVFGGIIGGMLIINFFIEWDMNLNAVSTVIIKPEVYLQILQTIISLVALIGLFIAYKQMTKASEASQKQLSQERELSSKQYDQNVELLKKELTANYRDLIRNHKLSQRQFTMQELFDKRDLIMPYITIINKNKKLSYMERDKSNPYSIKLIHKIICGKANHNKNPSITKEGKVIKQAIFKVLNYYEYIAAGINAKVFDEEMVKRLTITAMVKTYTVFGPYINHLRTKHNKENLFIELEFVVKSWKKKKKIKKERESFK